MRAPDHLVYERPWPLTGRRRELDLVRASLAGARPRGLMLVGPAGVGKTRLAREAETIAAGAGREVIWMSATHSVARTPLGVFAHLLPAQDTDVVCRTGPDTFEDALHRLARALLARSNSVGLTLVVDDAHLLDERSAGLIHLLASAHAVLVVLTVRSGEPAPAPVTALWKDGIVQRVELDQLGIEAVAELLTAALGGQVDDAAIADLATRCGGNVLFLRELTLGALVGGALAQDLGVWRLRGELAPSERIIELVDARLADLDGPSLALLEAAAYAEPLGRAEVARLTAPSLVHALERQGILVSRFDGRRVEIRLAHPLYGEVVRRRASAVRAAELGRTLAGIVESTGARRRDDALRLGIWRLDGGGESPDVMLRAGHSARWHYDFVLAERLARAAINVGAGFEAQLLAAQAVTLQGRAADAEIELAAMVAGTDVDRARLAIAHIDCLWLCLGRMDDGLRVAEQAEATIGDPLLRDEVSARRAVLALGREGPGAAASIAVPLLERSSGRSLVWSALVASFSLGRQGQLQAALDAADRGYAAAIALDESDVWYPWFLLHSRCEALAYAGRFEEAEMLARQEYQRGLDEGSSEARAWFLWHLCRASLERGRVQSAAHDAREAVALLRQLGRLALQHTLLSLLAQSLAMAGDSVGATEALGAIAALEIEQPRWSWTEFLRAEAWTAVAEGRLSAARERLRFAADAGEEVGDLTGAVSALHDLARLGGAHEGAERMAALSVGMDGELVVLRVRHAQALAAHDPPALAGMAEAFHGLGAHLLAAEAAADAASAWRTAGRVHRAEAQLRRTRMLLTMCESVRTPALTASIRGGELTPAEQETALLAARGHTSRQIADALVLSVRTVENRLQRVYQKLGISGRSELAEVWGVLPTPPAGGPRTPHP